MKLQTAFLIALCALCGFTHAAEPSKPNVIVFVTDDQVKDEVACYGGKVLTPNLDRLAREGLRFDNFHVPATVCTPSRYTLLTGRFPGNSYFASYLAEHPLNRQGNPGFNVGLEDDNMNVGNVLREAGYATGWVGKLHVGPELKRRNDFEVRGLYYTESDARPDSPEVIAGWQRNEQWFREWVKSKGFSWAKHCYWGNIKTPYDEHNPEWTLEAALEFIEANKDRPFYLHYTPTLMHGGGKAWTRSKEFPLHSGAGKLEKLPDVIAPREAILQQVENAGLPAATFGFTWMDATVGAMLDRLDRLGLAENTLFVFLSDHGTTGKWTLHDHEGTDVPCLMRWPKVIASGGVCTSLMQSTDLVPTFLDVAGVTKPEGYRIDGVSLHPVLADPSAKVHDHLYFELGNARAVRTSDWKYIAVRYEDEQFQKIQSADLKELPRALAYIGNDKAVSNNLAERPHFLDSDQLYHLTDDPQEMTNLAADPRYAEKLAEMKQLLLTYLKAQGRPFGEFIPGLHAVSVEQIQPYVRQLAKLKPVKRGFEAGDDESDSGKTALEPSRQEKKRMRDARKVNPEAK